MDTRTDWDIALRHEEPVVVHGETVPLLAEHEQVVAYVRRHAGRELLVVVNASSEDGVVADLPDADAWADAELVLTNRDAPSHRGFVLAPWEARVHRRG